MKLDKETLVKHQFWLLLGLSGVLILAALVLLFLGPRSQAAKARKQFDDAKASLGPKAPKDPKNASFLGPWNERRDFFKKHKETVWKQAWQPQSDIMTWPPGFPRQEALEKGYFGDDIPDAQRLSYKETYYDKQFTPEAFFAPTVSEGGVYFPVTFDKTKIFGRREWGKTVPTIEECWLAQEDIWVRREILKVLQGALRAMGHFNPVRQPLWKDSLSAAGGVALDALVRRDPQAKVYKEFGGFRLKAVVTPTGTVPVADKQPLKGIVKSLLFRSHNWEVNLLLEPKPNSVGDLQISRHSTIKNINPAGRALALNNGGKPRVLRLWQSGSKGRIDLQGELLRWGEHAEFKNSRLNSTSINLKQDFDLEEEFDTTTSPVKSLETLVLGQDAIYHRFVAGGFEMQKGRMTPKPKEPAENPEAQSGAPASPMGGGPPGGATPPAGAGKMMQPGGVPGQGGKASEDLTPNGINRVRYVLSKEIEPVRRIPVAFTIVVDQAYRNEVLAAVANSRLRIQTTQVYWAHRDYKQLKGKGVVGGFELPRSMMMMRPGAGPTDGPMGSFPPGAGSGGKFPMSPPVPAPGIGAPPPVVGSSPPGVGSGPPGVFPMPPGPGVFPPAGEPVQPADNAVSDHNLIELTVHGVAALFEHYPPKKKPVEGETPTNPAAPK